MSEQNHFLTEILVKLRHSLANTSTNAVSSIFSLTLSLERNPPSVEDMKSFLIDVHDILVNLDSARKSSIFRVIRYCLSSSAHVKVLLSNEIVWFVIISLEQDNESNTMERVQALKLIEKVRKVASELFPVGFGRSLVAVANSKEDSFRKVCIDAIRELALSNPSLVAIVHGFPTLLDAVLDPINQDSAESIIYTILYLLNDPQTR